LQTGFGQSGGGRPFVFRPVRLEFAATAYLRMSERGSVGNPELYVMEEKIHAETQRIRSEEGRGWREPSLTQKGDLEISEFGGLRAAQHAVADEGKFGDQIVGIRARQCGSVDFCRQQNHRRDVCAAFQAIFLESSREIEDFPIMTANAATST
jgi:hypothetical protein